MNVVYVSLKDDFCDTPGARFARQGKHSAEEFFERVLAPGFEQAVAKDADLVLDLDGTAGVAASFLDEICQRLVSRLGDLSDRMIIISEEEPELVAEISRYLEDAAVRERKRGNSLKRETLKAQGACPKEFSRLIEPGQ